MFVSKRAPASFKLVILFVFLFIVAAQGAFASTISGMIYDNQRNPLQRIDVELLNENYALRQRTKTNGVGRYQFEVIADGRYYIRALPFRSNLEDQTQEVIVETLSQLGQGSGFFQKDLYLTRKKGGLGDTVTGVVFVQAVPKEAETLYKGARKDFAKEKTAEGRKKLVRAIKVHSGYYAAMQLLGLELLVTKEYADAAKLFMRAAQINPKSSRSFYYMGFAFNKLGKEYNKSALASLKKATVLAPASFEVALLFGKIERDAGNFIASEKRLLRAKKLAGEKVPAVHIELAQLYGNDLKQYGKAADELALYLKASKKKDKKIEQQISDLRNKAKS